MICKTIRLSILITILSQTDSSGAAGADLV